MGVLKISQSFQRTKQEVGWDGRAPCDWSVGLLAQDNLGGGDGRGGLHKPNCP